MQATMQRKGGGVGMVVDNKGGVAGCESAIEWIEQWTIK